jgi:hypothetical protein
VGMKVRQNEFFNTLFSAMELKPTGNMTLLKAPPEIFEIKSGGEHDCRINVSE